MIVILFAFVYISFICYYWGLPVINFFQKNTGTGTGTLYHFTIVNITGLAVLTCLAGFLSLFVPLGKWWIQLLVFVPALLQATRNSASLKQTLRSLSGIKTSALFLFFTYLVLVLLMSSWTIGHPDTIGYHAQTIEWIKGYKAVPGLVNLHSRFGYQGQWYVITALFNFDLLGISGVNFLNTTVMLWFGLFICSRIDHYLKEQPGNSRGILWLAIFCTSLLSYTQIRLTVTSASPDFIAAVLLLLIFYLFLTETDRSGKLPVPSLLLILLLSSFCITIKLSSLPVFFFILYGLFILFKRKENKKIVLTLSLCLLFAIPFITRNIISSGYIIFPSVMPDWITADWKYPKAGTLQESHYITAYARLRSGASSEEIKASMSKGIKEWLPFWWQMQSVADKCILLFMAIAVAVAAFFYKRSVYTSRVGVSFLIATAGVVFWFITAPDPRFGFGFIIALPAILLFHIRINEKIQARFRKIFSPMLIITGLGMLGYSGYRSVHFFNGSQLVTPLGLEKLPYKEINYKGLIFRIPANGYCGDAPPPCMYDDTPEFIPRGTTIEEGFRPK